MKANKVNGVNQWKKRSVNPIPSTVNGFMVLRVENWTRYFRCRVCGHEFRLDVKGKVTVKAICPNPLCKNAKVVRGM